MRCVQSLKLVCSSSTSSSDWLIVIPLAFMLHITFLINLYTLSVSLILMPLTGIVTSCVRDVLSSSMHVSVKPLTNIYGSTGPGIHSMAMALVVFELSRISVHFLL